MLSTLTAMDAYKRLHAKTFVCDDLGFKHVRYSVLRYVAPHSDQLKYLKSYEINKGAILVSLYYQSSVANTYEL